MKRRSRGGKSAKGFKERFKFALKVIGVLCVLGVVFVGFLYFDEYVRRTNPVARDFGELELVDVPAWVSSTLLEQIASAAGGKEFLLDEYAAKDVATRLQEVAWLYDIRVQTTKDSDPSPSIQMINLQLSWPRKAMKKSRPGKCFTCSWATSTPSTSMSSTNSVIPISL